MVRSKRRKQIIIRLFVGTVFAITVIAGIIVEAFYDNKHWRSEKNAHEKYEKMQEESPETETEIVESTETEGYRITPFYVVKQYPELPTGCEITALTMVLNYHGYDVDKMEMAMEYLPKVEAEFYELADGTTIGPDMRQYFVGDPTGDGYICGNIAIETAANSYLSNINSPYSAVAMENVSPETLYDYVENDSPVVVWVTINMEDREETDGWYLEDGTYMEWSGNDHGAVLIGYSENTVTIADPIYDIVICSRKQFERIFAERGSQCVVLEKQDSI